MWMPTLVPDRILRQDSWDALTNTKHPAHGYAHASGERSQHRPGGLACRQHVHSVSRLQLGYDIGVFERMLYECSGIHGVHSGTHDERKIVFEIVEGIGQLIWVGSVQAESPVTTSNC
jgi:hypothetical protein